MAKSARSSRIKTNKSKLAAAVFRPVEDARIARLSEKVLAIANSSKKTIHGPGEMEIEAGGKGAPKASFIGNAWVLTGRVTELEKLEKPEEKEGAMEIDGEKPVGLSKKKINASRVRRRGRQSKHAVVFPSVQKGSAKGGIRKGVGRRSKK